MLVHERREPEKRRGCRPQEHVFGVLDDAWQELPDVFVGDVDGVMLGGQRVRHLLLKHALVVAAMGERDRERLQGARELPLRQRADERRIDAAREVGGDGNIGAQA
jgi:hypothetical protein